MPEETHSQTSSPLPPTGPGPETVLVLKVDIDTKVGFTEGVPRLLETFSRLGIRASFFVAMGPDHSGRALKRLFRPGFLAKQLHSGAASAYGPLTMLYGLVLPGPIIAEQAPGLIERCLELGHEVGLHGWDHVFWHDHLRSLEPARVRLELGRAWRLYRRLTGLAPAAFAAPGWQITGPALEALLEMGVSHLSCTRGRHPFRPRVGGRTLPLLELPTTLPTFDEALCLPGIDPGNLAAYLADCLRPGRINVFTMHGEVEGRALLGVFGDFCRILLGRGVRFLRLVDAARRVLAAGPVPGRELDWIQVPGRAYQVAAPRDEGP